MTSSPTTSTDERSRLSWSSHALWPLAALAATVAVLEATTLDLAVAERFYDRAAGRWIWGQSWWSNQLIHDGGKYLVFLIGVTAMALWAASFAGRGPAVRRLRPLRRAAGFVWLTIGLSTGIVAASKHRSVIGCPRNLALFGGERPYVRLFDPRPPGLGPGGCFPGGHSSGGFSLVAFYFVLRERRRRLALAALGLGLAVGLIFAFGQWARGAHFPSHDLWSAAVCWAVALGLYALVFGGRLWQPVRVATAAAARRPAAVLVAGLLAASLCGPPAVAEGRPALSGGNRGCGERTAAVPADEVLEAEHAVISHVDVLVGDVFDLDDPAEDRRVFGWANRLHRDTRAGVIRSQLLVRSGDRYSRRLLEESERLLRQRRYLGEVCVRPVGYHDHQVEIEVSARDVWTLSGGFSFGRKGGTNSTSFNLQDTNFLGSGTELEVRRSSNVDRSGTQISFHDPSLGRLHADLELGYADNSDGTSSVLRLERPFFSLDSRWAAGFTGLDDDAFGRLYVRGEPVDVYRHQQRRLEIAGGLSRGLRDGRALRLTFGATYAEDRFLAAPDEAPPLALPADRLLAYPWVGFDYVEDAFVEASDLDHIYRTEDRYVGLRLGARLGFSSPIFGGDRERLVFGAELTDAWQLANGDLVELAAALGGRWGRDGGENLLASASCRYYRRDLGRHLLFVRLEAAMGSELDLDAPLYLGGDSGLRGYPLRYQLGDRRWLFTVEQRFFTDWHPLHLARIGAVAFVDVGRAWTAGGVELPGDPGGGVLADLGVGLRLGLSHSGSGSVIHIDAAVPLSGDGSISGLQWLVSTHKSF